jgi:hypothetical protein
MQKTKTRSDELTRLRELRAIEVLSAVAEHVKRDSSFKPRASSTTSRVHVRAAGSDWELLIDGPKFFDTRARKGGGGAIDLVMYLWRAKFNRAIEMLREAGL